MRTLAEMNEAPRMPPVDDYKLVEGVEEDETPQPMGLSEEITGVSYEEIFADLGRALNLLEQFDGLMYLIDTKKLEAACMSRDVFRNFLQLSDNTTKLLSEWDHFNNNGKGTDK